MTTLLLHKLFGCTPIPRSAEQNKMNCEKPHYVLQNMKPSLVYHLKPSAVRPDRSLTWGPAKLVPVTYRAQEWSQAPGCVV